MGGRLKAHKAGYPLRETSNTVGASGHELAKALNKVFSAYVGNTKSYLRNGEHSIQILRTGRFDKGIRVKNEKVKRWTVNNARNLKLSIILAKLKLC